MERRATYRLEQAGVFYPVSFVGRKDGQEYRLEVVNYDFGGACLKLPTNVGVDDLERMSLDFHVGQKCLRRDLGFKICWRDLAHSRTVGIQFLDDVPDEQVARAARVAVHQAFKPQVSATDPLNPTRKLVLTVENISQTGALLATSLSNKHLFPGMTLEDSEIMLPGFGTERLAMQIRNTRRIQQDEGQFHLGVSFRDPSPAFKKSVAAYLTMLAPGQGEEERIKRLKSSRFRSHSTKAGLTYKVVTAEEDYRKILKLRYAAYGRHGKLKAGATWEDQGEGLHKEGLVLAAILGGEIVASMELRFGGEMPLRSEVLVGPRLFDRIDLRRTMEINRLVIHPDVQGTDAVVGLIRLAHAIVMSRGGLDVLLAATDQLVRFYRKIGAIKLGLTAPHPHLTNTQLNLMLIPRDAYTKAAGLNPYAWSLVYQATHDHMAELGVVEKATLTLWQRILMRLTPLVARLLKRKKNKGDDDEPLQDLTRQRSYVEPKWTKQHMGVGVLLPYILEADEMIGKERVDTMLERIGVPRDYFKQPGRWISVDFLDRFLEEFGQFGSIERLSVRAGHRSMRRDVMGLNYHLLKHFVTPELAFPSFAKIASKFNRTRTYRLEELSAGYARVAVGIENHNLLPKHREGCLNWVANFESYIELMTGKPGRVRKTSCCFDGADACRYEIRWSGSRRKVQSFLWPVLGAGAAVGVYLVLRGLAGDLVGALVGILTLSTSQSIDAMLRRSRERRERDALGREFERHLQASEDRYQELQKAKQVLAQRYDEARLLEETSRRIQGYYDATEILSNVLDSVCTKFDFDRAFAMILDKDQAKLRTAAIAGIDEGREKVLAFTVDVGRKRDNPLLLSSVFHSGQPILIDDLERHLFQLNDASRELIRVLDSRGFVIIPIPAHEGRWGVIVADRVSSRAPVEYGDLVLLQRIALHLGVALDKQARLEREMTLRRIFQKYVPETIVAQCDEGGGEPTLGGENRPIIAMFLDIRNYTAMSSRLLPHQMVTLLNRVFGVVEGVVTESGGLIDKFLGDGVLVTWGAVGQMPPPERAIEAALGILDRIDRLNEELKHLGLPRISVGMGLERGDAIVGNIGSSNRMEFTAIGQPVNIASRLEGLCKVHDTEIVLSENFLEAIASDAGSRWEIVEDVQIRGLGRSSKIAILKKREVLWTGQQSA